MTTSPYKHTQIGWVIIISMLVLILIVAVPITLAVSAGAGYFPVIMGFVLLLILASFASLTVTVDEQNLRARFGIGPLGKTIPLSEVRAYHVSQTPWYYGWGIRFIPGGILYNVSGTFSVEFILKSGKRVRIGTDEPHALLKAVQSVLGELPPLSAQELVVQKKAQTKGIAIAGAITLIVFTGIGSMMYFQSRPPTVIVSSQSVSVKSLIYSQEFQWREVTDLSLQQSLPRILLRTNGYALGSTLRGHFNVEGLGNGQLFIEASTSPFIVIRKNTEFVVINFQNPAETQALYATMKTYWSATE